MCHDLASLSEYPSTHTHAVFTVLGNPQPYSHLGSLLGETQSSAIGAKDSAWLSLLTLEWEGRKDRSGLTHWPSDTPTQKHSRVLAYYGEFMTRAL